MVASADVEAVWLGLDIGTQGCRAVAVDDAGRQLALAREPLTSRRSGARHEQDPADWVAAAARALAQLWGELVGRRPATTRDTDDSRRPPRIGGLAICATSGSLVIADQRLRPLTPGLMYDDARGAALAEPVADIWRECSARNAYRIAPTWALVKLVGLLRQDPTLAGGRLFHVADYVGSWLAGTALATDTSHALKTGYDLVADRWPAAELDRAGIPATVLPPVVRPGTILGAVGRAAQAATGLPAGTPIVAGMTDGCGSQLAAGAVHAGQWNSALGTTLVLKGVSERLLADPQGAVYSHLHPDGGWMPGGASSSGTRALSATFPGVDPADVDRLAESALPTDLISYPIVQRGERFPFVRTDLEPFRSAVPANDAELAASLMQGVAFVERLSLAHLAELGADVSGDISFTGGATRSAVWNQLRADVLGRVIRLPRHPEAAVGMAVVAAARGRSVAGTADAMVADFAVVEPRPDRAERWRDRYLSMVEMLRARGYIADSMARAAAA